MNIKSLSILLLGVLITSAFTKSKKPHQDKIDITIHSPTENSKVAMGDTVFIKATVASTTSLHNINITVKTADGTLVLFSDNIHSHGNKEIINKFYIQTIKYKTDLILEIKTSDHSGSETASKSVKFQSSKKK